MVIAIIAGILGAIVVAIIVATIAGNRRLRQMPTTRIADCKEGELVKIVGRVTPTGEALSAPFTQRPCVAYGILGQGPKPDDPHRRLFTVTAARLTTAIVDNGSGTAIVDASSLPRGPQFNLHVRAASKKLRSSGIKAQDTAAAMPGLKLLGLKSSDSYEECVIEPGDHVAVIGRVVWDVMPEATGGYRDGSGHRVRIVPPQRSTRFVITNLQKLIG